VRRFLASFAVRLAALAIASNATKRLRSGRFFDGDLNFHRWSLFVASATNKA
jgi:hypothetical protein